MGLLSIEQAKNKLRYHTDSYDGYKTTRDGNSVISPGEVILAEIVSSPNLIEKKLPDGRKAPTCIVGLCIMEKDKEGNLYKDNENIKVLITLKDYNFLTNIVKAREGLQLNITATETYNKFKKRKQMSTSWINKNKTPKLDSVSYDEPNTELVSAGKKRVLL